MLKVNYNNIMFYTLTSSLKLSPLPTSKDEVRRA